MDSLTNLGPVINDASYFQNELSRFENKLTFGHLNCQSIRPSNYNCKVDDLKSILVGSGLDIFAVSETWLKPYVSTKSVAIPGYKFFRKDRPVSRGGGVGVYLSERLRGKVIFSSENFGVCESLFIEIKFGSSKLLFGVVYLPHGAIDVFEETHANLFGSYAHVIVVGDFNCNLFDIFKSAAMRSVCMRLGMSISHNSSPTHYDLVHNSCSLLDYVLTTFAHLGFSSQVQCPSISHHSLIFGSVDLAPEYQGTFFEYRHYGRMNWNSIFDFLVHFDFNWFYATSDVNQQFSVLDGVIKSLFSFVPLVRSRKVVKTDDYLRSPLVLCARSLRDIAYAEYMRDPSEDNGRIYRSCRNRAKAVLRNERRKHCITLFKDMDNSQLWKSVRSFGCVVDDNDESELVDVDAVNDYFVSNRMVNTTGLGVSSSDPDTFNAFSFDCIFEYDFLKAMRQVKSNALGVDGIPIKFLRMIYPFISRHLLHFFNTILTTSRFPDGWKIARVTPLPKTGGSYQIDNLRPISVLPALSKIMEYVMNAQMLDFLSEYSMLDDFQYGFRRGFSTTSHLLHLTDAIRGVLDRGESAVLIGLDLTKAFDSVVHTKLIGKLFSNFNFSSSACRLISSYLMGRSQYVSIGDRRSSLRNIECGVPQGSVIGPLLFILYVNDIRSGLNSLGVCDLFMYADDLHILFSGSSLGSLGAVVNSTLGDISNWLAGNNLYINPSKTKAMFFNSSRHVTFDFSVFIDGSRIEFVDEMKCLGVIIDRRLDFSRHVDILSSKVLFQLRRLYSVNVYLPTYIKRRVALALLMSHVSYCIEVVSGTTSVNMGRIERVFNSVVRYVYGLRRYDHVSVCARHLLGLPFRKFVDLRLLQSFYGLMTGSGSPLLRSVFCFSRSTRNPQILLPRFSSALYARSYCVRVARLWNSLPLSLRNFSLPQHSFRDRCSEHILSLIE